MLIPLIIAVSAACLCTAPACMAQTASLPRLTDFAGAVNPPGGPLWTELGVGWGRQDFSWNEIEPANDDWRFERYDSMVLNAHNAGCEILPILAYTAGWAGEEANPNVPRLAEWEDFVDTVVSRYKAEPYNLKYFQVWNEPTIKAGFWKGDSDRDFFTKVYMPAARIIRRHGCKVVFGGWPCSNSIEQYMRLLDDCQAWQWTDILDVHYNGLGSMVTLWDRYVATGLCEGVWQTEVGWHPFEEYLPSLYCRALSWWLRKGPRSPDQVKLFWYAFWGAGPDSANCLTAPAPGGSAPTQTHGVRMRTLNNVLGGGDLRAFVGYSTVPQLPFTTGEEEPSSQGFRVGTRTVIAFQMSPEQVAVGTLEVKVALEKAPSKAELWSSTGEVTALVAEDAGNGQWRLAVPLGGLKPGVARNWGRKVEFAIGYVMLE